MTIAQRSIRLSGRIAPGLDRITGENGELYYDTTAGTLRLYNGRALGGELIATRDYVSSELVPYALSTDLIGLATETYVNTAVSNLVDAAPGALNTLNELAAAINDDANYASTITTALGLKAPLASPTLTGTPLAPTATAGTNTTQVATTAFVRTEVANLVAVAPAALDTLNELAAALGNDASFSTTVTTSLGLKAPINNPTFTGTVGGITKAMVGLGNVTNESKETMFTSPVFSNPTVTGEFYGLTALMVGLGNVTNESKATMFTDPTFTGNTSLQLVGDAITKKTAATGVVDHNCSEGSIWYHTGMTANFTANFTNVPTTDMRGISLTVILLQTTTAYIPNAVQIDGVAQTINWQNGAQPPGNPNRKDMVNFLLTRINGIWSVAGSLATYA